MKTNTRTHFPWLALTAAILFTTACKKDSLDLFGDPSEGVLPEVEMVSVGMLDDETVLLKGRVLSQGKGEAGYAGFCFGEMPVPDMMQNQILRDGEKGEFTAEITGLEGDSTYYFRCFVTNDYGYVYGDKIIKFTVPNPQPPVVPCTNPEGFIKDANGSNRSISSVETGPDASWAGDHWGVLTTCSGLELRMEFNGPIKNGIYTTSSLDDVAWDNRAVYVRIRYGFDTYTIYTGDKVYVTKNTDGSFNVEFCDLKYKMFSSDLILKGNIRTD